MIKRFHKAVSKILPILNTLLIIVPLWCSLFISDQIFTVKIKIFVLIAVAVCALMTYFVSDRNISMERAQNKLSIEILKGERDITKYRCDMILESFKNTILHNEIHQKLNYSPYEKIAFILKSISLCFETFLEIRPKYVSVAVFYHFDYQEDDKWNRLDKNYCQAYGNDEEVILDDDSFGKFVMEGTEGFYLINDKYYDGAKKKKYKINPKDTETKGKFHRYGSIMGTKIIVKIDNKEYIQALLTISTYGKKIDTVPFGIFREKLECKIEDDILPVFKTNIESELMQIYLEEMNQSSN